MAYDVGVRLGVDGEKTFKASLSAVDAQLKNLGAEMAAVTASFAKNSDSQAALAAKNEVLARSIDAAKGKMEALTKEINSQKEKLTGLDEALEKAKKEFGESSEEAVKAQNAYNAQARKVTDLETKLTKAKTSVANMTAAMEDNSQAMAYGGTEMAEFSEHTRGAAESLEKAGKAGLSFGDIIKANVVSDAIVGGVKALGGALKSAGSALVGFAKDAIVGYGDYEQLVGGVQTLFGTEAETLEEYAAGVGKATDEVAEEYARLRASQDAVFANANNAFKTAGLSANEYMETVTGFAASLLQSLGGDTMSAAEKADLALTDMADNANKMGTAMESIQNAYQGFAKQNYTMLDNLKLGYGGTKAEMERLLADAQKLSGMEYDISSYGDIVDAIHVVQTEMGITGTTALEASSTIQGSVNATKAAWSNLVAGMADENADMDALMSDLVDSAGTAAENIVPRIRAVFANVGRLLPDLARTVGREAPGAIAEAVPAMLEAGGSLVTGLAEGAMEAAPELWDSMKETASNALAQFDMEEALETGGELIGKIARGSLAAIPKINAAIGDVVKSIWDRVKTTDWPELGASLINGFISGITGKDFDLAVTVNGVKDNVKKSFLSLASQASQWGKDMIDNFLSGIASMGGAIKDKVSGVAQTVKDFIGFSEPKKGPLSNFHTYAPDMMELFAKGISDNASMIQRAFNKSLNLAPVYADVAPGMGNPSGGMLDQFAALLSQAVNAMGTIAAGGGGRYVVEVHMNVNGKEFYRETLDDLRFVERSTPEVT